MNAYDMSIEYTAGQPRRARTTDPLTSHAAADGAAKFADSHAARILHVLQDAPPDGMCASEISDVSGLTVVQIDRRTIELQRKGLIRTVQRNGRDLIVGGMRCWEVA